MADDSPLAFFSQKPEWMYSTFDKELLAVYLAERHFRHMFEGTSYIIFADLKPLVNTLSMSRDCLACLVQ